MCHWNPGLRGRSKTWWLKPCCTTCDPSKLLGHAHTLWGIGSHSLQSCKCGFIPRFIDHWSQDPNAESAPVIPIHNIGDLYTVYWILNYLAVRKCGCGRTQKATWNTKPLVIASYDKAWLADSSRKQCFGCFGVMSGKPRSALSCVWSK